MGIEKNNFCEICRREVSAEYMERHHLIPKNKKSDTINVCANCGDFLHQKFSHYELKYALDTLEKILDNEHVVKWIAWISKKDSMRVCMKNKKRRK